MQSSIQIVAVNKPTSSFLQAGCPSCRPINGVKALNGKYINLIVIVSIVEVLGLLLAHVLLFIRWQHSPMRV